MTSLFGTVLGLRPNFGPSLKTNPKSEVTHPVQLMQQEVKKLAKKTRHRHTFGEFAPYIGFLS